MERNMTISVLLSLEELYEIVACLEEYHADDSLIVLKLIAARKELERWNRPLTT